MIDQLIIIRHGMRLDFEDPNWHKSATRPYDPPLANVGFVQAKETASYLADKKIKHLFSSPFLRTLQTADVIAEKLKINIKVEHGFSEWMNIEWFDHMPELLKMDEINKEFGHIDEQYKTIRYPVYPEYFEDDDVYDRVKVVLDEIIDKYTGNVVVIGHGVTIHEAGRVLLGSSELLHSGLCAVNVLQKNDDDWSLKNASVAHLKKSKHTFQDRFY